MKYLTVADIVILPAVNIRNITKKNITENSGKRLQEGLVQLLDVATGALV